jgi:hypothetical protein
MIILVYYEFVKVSKYGKPRKVILLQRIDISKKTNLKAGQDKDDKKRYLCRNPKD